MKNDSDVTITVSVLWMVGWLFTIGFADLSFWRGLLALLLWPYYVGHVTAGAL